MALNAPVCEWCKWRLLGNGWRNNWRPNSVTEVVCSIPTRNSENILSSSQGRRKPVCPLARVKTFFQPTRIFTVVWLANFGRHLRAYNKSKSWLHPWLLYPFSSNISCMKQWRVYGSLYWNLKCPAIFVKGLVRTFLSTPIKMYHMHNVHTFRC